MKKNNGTIRCEVCGDRTASHFAVNQYAPIIDDSEERGGHGYGRITILLCVACAAGPVGAVVIALGNVLLKLFQ